MTTAPDHYAVMGNPIAHSKSPQIHALFAVQTGQNLEYRAILVEPGQFATAARNFRAEGGKGLNITVPFKQDAWVFADILSARAETGWRSQYPDIRPLRGARRQHRRAGTGARFDGESLVMRWRDGGFCCWARAARRVACCSRCCLEKPEHVVIANRTAKKALELSMRFSDLGRVSGRGFAELVGRQFDLIINATAAGLDHQAPQLPDEMLAPPDRRVNHS